MVSYAGESAVSGVSLVNQLNNVFILVFSALAAGGSVIASQYVGSGDKEDGIDAASQLLMITTLIAVVMTAVTLLFGHSIFTALFGAVEQDVYTEGMTYLRISAYSFVGLAIYNACAGLYRSMGKTKELMYVSFAMNGINVIGNSIGIFVLHAGVAQSFWSMAALFCLAMGPAFITVVGQYMGANDPEGAQYYMKKLLRITYIGGIVWNVLFFMISPLLLKLYDLSAETVRLVLILALLHNFFNALFCPLSFALSSGLRAAGDVKFNLSGVVCL